VHLARQANRVYRARIDTARCKRLPDGPNGGVPPVLRILLGPCSLRRTECDVLCGRRAGDAAVAANEDGT